MNYFDLKVEARDWESGVLGSGSDCALNQLCVHLNISYFLVLRFLISGTV